MIAYLISDDFDNRVPRCVQSMFTTDPYCNVIHHLRMNSLFLDSGDQLIMPSELDPLLPKTKPAPEISGHGFWERPSHEAPELDDGHDESTPPSSSTNSSLSRIIALLIIAASVILFIVLVLPGSSRSKDEDRQKDNATIAARVDKILTQTPLIGYYLTSLV